MNVARRHRIACGGHEKQFVLRMYRSQNFVPIHIWIRSCLQIVRRTFRPPVGPTARPTNRRQIVGRPSVVRTDGPIDLISV